MPWYALHVRSNYEARVSENLRDLGIEYFSPTQPLKSRFGRDGIIHRPLLPGYVFALLDLEAERIPALRIVGVVRIVGFGLSPAAIPDAEVEALRLLLASGVPVRKEQYQGDCHPRKGDHVEIVCGPLAGRFAVVDRFKSKFRIVLSVHVLQQTVSAEVDGAWLRPAKKAA